MTELARYKKAVDEVRRFTNERASASFCIELRELMDAILNPPVELEDIYVEVWAGVDTTTKTVTAIGTKESVSLAVDPSTTNLIKIVKLTGTLTRPKAVKVERSVSGEVRWETHQGFTVPSGPNIDWEALLHKTGYLTFAWTE